MSPIFAKKITIFHKTGLRVDYTHITEFAISNNSISNEPTLVIKGECIDSFGQPFNTIDRLPVKFLNMTVIDWYIPPV